MKVKKNCGTTAKATLLFMFAFLCLTASALEFRIKSSLKDAEGFIGKDGMVVLKKGPEKKPYLLRAVSRVPVQASKKYVFSFEVKVDSADNKAAACGIIYFQRDDNGKIVSVPEAKYKESKGIRNGSWQKVSMQIVQMPVSVNSLNLGLCLVNGSDANASFRNIEFKESEISGQNLKEGIIYQADFSKTEAPVTVTSANTKFDSRFSGTLPDGWKQNFVNWTSGKAKSEILEENGKPFLRITVQKGPIQFYFPVDNMRDGKYYRITASTRCSLANGWKGYVRLLYPYYTLSIEAAFPSTLTEWMTVSNTIQFKERRGQEKTPYAFFITSPGSGVLDFREFAIKEFDRSKLLNSPGENTKNYLRNSRLPLGIQTGWTERGKCASVEVLKEERGPSGEPPLRLTAIPRRPAILLSEPFAVASTEKEYTASFSYKGEGHAGAAAVSGRAARKEIVLKPASQWQRTSFDFKLKPTDGTAVLRFTTSGNLCIDAFRVAEKGQTEYVPQNQCEVAFCLPESDVSAGRIQFDDEKAEVNYYLSGEFDGADLYLEIENLYGEKKKLPPRKLNKNKPYGKIDYLVFPKREYGQFLIVGKVVKNGQVISPLNELVVSRFRRPVYWGKDAPDSPFGTLLNQVPRAVAAVKAGGINWTRIHDGSADLTGWFFLEPRKGKWFFRDEEINLYRKNHLKIYGQLGTTPGWAAWKGANLQGYFKMYAIPDSIDEFTRYVETVAKRYKGIIDDWHVFNEPYLACFFNRGYHMEKKSYLPLPDAAAEFAKFQIAAYKAVKKANPQGRVSGFSTGTGHGKWTSAILDAGGDQYCDVFDAHDYTAHSGIPGSTAENELKETFEAVIKKYGRINKGVINGEGSPNWGTASDSRPLSGICKYSTGWKDSEDRYDLRSDMLIRFMVSQLAGGIERVFLYTAHAFHNFSHASGLQLLLSSDGYPHPTLAAHSAFAVRIEGKKFIRFLETGKNIVAVFSDGKNTTGVLMQGTSVTSCALPGIKASDIYGNPLEFPVVYRNLPLYLEARCSAEDFLKAFLEND